METLRLQMPLQQEQQPEGQTQPPSAQLEAQYPPAYPGAATLEVACEVDGSDVTCITSSSAEEEGKAKFENTEIQHEKKSENFNRNKRFLEDIFSLIKIILPIAGETVKIVANIVENAS